MGETLDDGAETAPAAGRNRGPIAAVLRAWLPETGLVLEVASGTGEHAAWFAADFPGLTWQPTEHDGGRLGSVAAWRARAGLPNLLAPVPLDAAAPEGWPVSRADAVLAVNMVHIAPWAATVGLMRGAGRVLPGGGVLVLYGPYLEAAVETGAGNLAFDASLRARDPSWGLRTREAVEAEAGLNGLGLVARVAMPANNLCLVFRRGGGVG